MPGVLQFAAAAVSVAEGAGHVVLTVSRTGGSDGAVSATLSTANGTALSGSDYTALTTSVAFADGEASSKSVEIVIADDATVEADESFTATLSAATGGATLGTPSSTTVTIQDDDVDIPVPAGPGFALDDTGVTGCSTATASGLPCNSAAAGTDVFPRQDAESGRDVTARLDGDGHAGFAFRKLDGQGVPLPDQAATSWNCLEDRTTGLTWEVKTDDGGPRDKKWRFTWFAAAGLRPGFGNGTAGGGSCAPGAGCDTDSYVAAVNAATLCGKTDWRLPARDELLSIVDYGALAAPLVDAAFLPETAAEPWWSSTADWTGRAFTVDFAAGTSHAERPGTPHAVRLVRGGF